MSQVQEKLAELSLEQPSEAIAGQEKVSAAAEDNEFSFDMTMKKKKKKKKAADEPFTEGEASSAAALEVPPGAPVGLTQGEYSYQEMLARIFAILRQNNPDLSGERRRFVIVPPQVAREGSKKTSFANLIDLCRRMNRPPEHVISFLLTELGTIGSLDGNQRLIIRGRFQQLQIENVLRKYIAEYVKCKMCRAPETQLKKENRIFFVECLQCKGQYSVSAIRSGFHAQVGRRSAARNQ